MTCPLCHRDVDASPKGWTAMILVDALATLPDLTADQRRDLDLDTRWTWAIIRRGRKTAPPSVRVYHVNQARARVAWAKLSVRYGWAFLVDDNGVVVDYKIAPMPRSRKEKP